MEWATAVTGLVGVAGIIGVSFNAARQREVELARIAADDKRRADDRQEERRLARQSAYARVIVALDLLDTYGSGIVPTDEAYEAAMHELNAAGSIIELVAPLEVREAQARVGAVYHAISARMSHFAGLGPGPPQAPLLTRAQQHEGAYRERRAEMLEAVEGLKEAMRGDLAVEAVGDIVPPSA